MKKINEIIEEIEKMTKEQQKTIVNLLKNVISEKKCTTEKIFNLSELIGFNFPRLYLRLSVKQIGDQNPDFKIWIKDLQGLCINILKILTSKNIIDNIRTEKTEYKKAFAIIGRGKVELMTLSQLKVQSAMADDDFEFEKTVKKEKILKEGIKNLQNKIDNAIDAIELELKSELSWLYE